MCAPDVWFDDSETHIAEDKRVVRHRDPFGEVAKKIVALRVTRSLPDKPTTPTDAPPSSSA